MIVMKFGGTSVGSAVRIKDVAKIVKANISKKPIIVVSAVTKITDLLIKLANESLAGKGEDTISNIKKTHCKIINDLKIKNSILDGDFKELENLAAKARKYKKLSLETLDYFQCFGEKMSSKIVAKYLSLTGIKSKALASWDLGFITDENFGNAEPLEESFGLIKKNVSKLKIVPVITGFVGRTKNGKITTLGRGGSDYTAAILGAAIGAAEIQIWTDVNGIMSTDPRIVSNAVTLEKVSFSEAAELAYFGAKVLHPKTILPAMREKIPVKVLNTMAPSNKGTTIISEIKTSQAPIKAIACKKNITMINIESTRMFGVHGFLAKLFSVFEKYKKSVDVISTSEISVSLTIDSDENLNLIAGELSNIGSIKISKNKAIICCVGDNMKYTPGIAGRTFTALGNRGINIEMISQGASAINVTFIVDQKDAEKAVLALHQEFIK